MEKEVQVVEGKFDLFKKDVEMTSLDIAELTGKKHKHVMADIRKEIQDLEGEIDQPIFRPTKRLDSQNRKQPCFTFGRFGAQQLAMRYDAVTRYRVNKHIEKLEQENKRLGQLNNEMHEIAISDEELETRQYQANLKSYGWQNIRTVLENCNYKNIEDKVEDIIDFHTNVLKKKDRANYPSHQEANKTEYKQIVRDRVYEVLTDIYNSTLDASLRTISSQVKEDVLLDKIGTINRSNSKKLSGIKEVYISDKPSDDQYIKLDTHGFSHNHQYEYDVWDDKWVRTEAYDRWLSKFPLYQLPDKDYWDVDWEEPIEIFIQYIAKPEVDIRNLDKSIIDKVFSVYCEDDNIVDEVHSKRIGDCHKYSDGEIRLFIRNVAAEEVAS